MADDKKFDLSRRKVLGSIGTIGVASAAAGAGTMALFKDDESFKSNTIEAGTLDLQLKWKEYYNNGKSEETSSLTDRGSDSSPVITIEDAKPGDSGCLLTGLQVNSNPGWVWMRTGVTDTAENGRNEPEMEVDNSSDTGELQNHLRFKAFYDMGSDSRPDMKKNCYLNQNQSGEAKIFGLKAKRVNNNPISDGVRLDADPSTGGTDAFQPAKTYWIAFNWWIPESAGNEIQSDSLTFDIDFAAQQERHNSNPSNPF